jgi:hypothetical protein
MQLRMTKADLKKKGNGDHVMSPEQLLLLLFCLDVGGSLNCSTTVTANRRREFDKPVQLHNLCIN